MNVASPAQRRRIRRRNRSTWFLASTFGFAIVLLTSFPLFWWHMPTHRRLGETSDLTPLRPIDRAKYTVRINTWKREELLRLSVEHHLSCPKVAQVQVVWCVEQGRPPAWLLDRPGVVVEVHMENTLNERFRIQKEPPTRGVFHVDDDVLRPCPALDNGFVKWTDNPTRLVGFDPRHHQPGEHWTYGEKSHTLDYSLALTKSAFLHRDYLQSYFERMPSSIRDKVVKYHNCEDIAMSLWISSETGGQPPLLADAWARQSVIALYAPTGISKSLQHHVHRDVCVDTFAVALQLKERLVTQAMDR